MDFYKDIPIMDADGPATDVSHPAGASFGMVPRDYSIYPEPMFAQPDQMQIIPQSEWDARFDEQEATKSSLEHLYLNGPNGEPAFVNLDQDGFPDCWAHSTAHSIMLDRLKQNLPIIKLNGVAAATLMNQTNGGWCGMSAQFARRGYPVMGTGAGEWPEHTRNRKYDTPALHTEMAHFKIEEDWVDLTRQVYDQNLTRAQLATCLFNNIACPVDFNWWGHSVCAVRWVRLEAGSWGLLILNSWLNWGRHGLGVLRGSQAIPNGSVATRLTTASAG